MEKHWNTAYLESGNRERDTEDCRATVELTVDACK